MSTRNWPAPPRGGTGMRDTSWHDRGDCLGMDMDLFYGPDGGETLKERRERERDAKIVCAGCEVRLLCLDDAIDRNDGYGIRGGKTPEERRLIRRNTMRRRLAEQRVAS